MKIATAQQQLEINGIITQLIKVGEEVFDPKLAEHLKNIVAECDLDLAPKSTITTVNRFSFFHKFQAFAAGIGNVSMDDSKKEIAKTYRGDAILSGNWVVSWRNMLKRTNGRDEKAVSIMIHRRFDETREAGDRESYALFYQPSGEPAFLSKAEYKTVYSVGLFGIRRVHMTCNFNTPFKRPAPMVPV